MKCSYGCDQEAKYYFSYSRKYCCSDNVSKCPKIREVLRLTSKRSRRRPSIPSPHKGKKLEDIVGPTRAKEIKRKISLKCIGGTGKGSTPEKEMQRKKKLSEAAITNKSGGYRKGSGIGKSGWYHKIWCDSSWELAFVIFNLEHNIPIKKNWKRFPYSYKEKVFSYIPDFIVNNKFVEVKGYETEEFKEKIRQFPNTIKIIGGKEIIKYLDYVTKKYGKNFIELYNK